ncbi:2OG-FE(II) OXYGENASE FAMILY PROTEIN [Salix purpurea]|uniref:DNA N(6)-methyladenine demethylase n=1 Tax=Salix purpurea TaxID=77065 RepID=A0A9Q0WEF2_SALPP|nr:2OG-FE(II) OXYGENASE FAMILY PROTEIN [Salix purpurea]
MVYMYRLIQAKNFRLLTSPVSVPSISRQVCSGLLSIRNMNSGKDRASEDSIPGRGGAGIKLRPSPDCIDRREWRGAEETSSDGLGARHGSFSKRRSRIDLRSEQSGGDGNSLKFRNKNIPAHVKRFKSGQSYCKPAAGANHVAPFDICLSRSRDSAVLKSLQEMEENQENAEHPIEERQRVLRPGMVLLKRYISLSDQIELVKTCREIGLGPGGFYRPGYKNGAKLRLQMMCLGLNWDPETRKYEDQDPTDGCKPPYIPCEFNQIVETAIQDAHALLGKDLALSDVEEILPAMSPDICIVNFYTTTGKLGLHQDRDESSESLSKGLPVVSFSVGDSAEFLYGDQRDVNKADKIVLESGDVLIFGGSSRHIFHGVTSVIPNSSPKALIEETRLRPGRLNLTFRQY